LAFGVLAIVAAAALLPALLLPSREAERRVIAVAS
jgi:hypothetical protein